MDPEELLAELRQMAADADEYGGIHAQTWVEDGPGKFAALDEWLSKGGFLPKDWSR